MRSLTLPSIVQLYHNMTEWYDTEVITKASAVEMKALAKFLDALGVMDSAAFMKEYATTVDHRIYLPCAPGSPKLSAISQAMICAHEHQHVLLLEDDGPAMYNLYYLGVPGKRAMYEAKCYQATAEVYYWWTKASRGTGDILNLNMKKILAVYGCDSKTSAPAVKMFEKALKVIAKGGVGCHAARDVINFYGWMDK
jgi:hypothetical protein